MSDAPLTEETLREWSQALADCNDLWLPQEVRRLFATISHLQAQCEELRATVGVLVEAANSPGAYDLRHAVNNLPAATKAHMEEVKQLRDQRAECNAIQEAFLDNERVFHTALERARKAEANARTPGTVEVCGKCGAHKGQDLSMCPQVTCPIRSATKEA